MSVYHMWVLHVRLVHQTLVKVVALCRKWLDTPAAGPWRRRNRVPPKRRERITDSWRSAPSTSAGVSVPVATSWDIFYNWDTVPDECRATWRSCGEVMFVVTPWRYIPSELCILSYSDFPHSRRVTRDWVHVAVKLPLIAVMNSPFIVIKTVPVFLHLRLSESFNIRLCGERRHQLLQGEVSWT
jgi:hypothetical protein